MDTAGCKNDRELMSCVGAAQRSININQPSIDEPRPCSMSGQSKYFPTRPFLTSGVATLPLPLSDASGLDAARTERGLCPQCDQPHESRSIGRRELGVSAESVIQTVGTDRTVDPKRNLRFFVEFYSEAVCHRLSMNSKEISSTLFTEPIAAAGLHDGLSSSSKLPKTSTCLANHFSHSYDVLIGSR